MNGRRAGAAWTPFLLLAAALAAALFWPYLTFRRLYLFTDIGSDTVSALYPRLVALADHLRAWGVPRWSFQHGMGASVFGRDIGDPFNLVLAALGHGHLAWGIGWVEAAKVVIGGALFFAYLGLLDLRPFARTVGGLCFAFSGFMIVGGTWYTFSTEAVYLAGVLYAFERGFTKGRWGLLPLVFCLIALGRPFALYTHGMFLGAYAAARWIASERPLGRLPLLWGRLGGLAVLGAAMGAVLLVNQLAIMAQSPRAAGEASLVHGLMSLGLLHPAPRLEYATLVSRWFGNDLYGTGSAFTGWVNYLEAPLCYVGLPALLLCPLAFGLLSPRERWGHGGLLAVCALPLALPGLRQAFWLYIGDYYRCLGLFAGLAVLIPSLIALDRIERGARPNLMVLGAALAGYLGVLYLLPAPPGAGAWGLRVAAFLVVYAALLAGVRLGMPRGVLRWVLVGVLVVELGVMAHPAVAGRPVITAADLAHGGLYRDDYARAVAGLAREDGGFYRVSRPPRLGLGELPVLNDAMVLGFRGTPVYDNFNHAGSMGFLATTGAVDPRDETATRWASGLVYRPVLETLCDVKYRLAAPGDRTPPAFVAASYVPKGRVGKVTVLENVGFLPLGVAFDRYVDRAAYDRTRPELRDVLLLNAVLVDRPEAAAERGLKPLDPAVPLAVGGAIVARRAEAMTLSVHTPDRFEGTIKLGGPRLLFLCIPFDAGWHARVDGGPVPIERVDGGLSGIYLEAGTHAVALAYHVPRLGVAAGLSVAGWGVWGVLFLRRRKGTA